MRVVDGPDPPAAGATPPAGAPPGTGVEHPLLGFLHDAASGRFPPPDGGVTAVPALRHGRVAVVSFTGHAVVAADTDLDELAARGADGFGGATHPKVLLFLAGNGVVGSLDVTMVAWGRGPIASPETALSLPTTARWDDHARVKHAHNLRDDVVVYGDDRGFVTLATGLAGRREMSVAVAEGAENRGTGRRLIEAALHLVDRGTPLFAGVAPGNARSLRAFLAEGFTPVASEVLITPSAADRATAPPVG